MLRPTPTMCLSLALCALAPAQDQKGLVLPFHQTRRTWRLQRDTDEFVAPEPVESTSAGELWLSATRCEVRDDAGRAIYDFEHGRLIQANVHQRTFTESSLMARIASRQVEFQHQQRVAQMLRRVSKGERLSADPFFVAARFGLDPGNTEAPQRVARDGVIEASYHGQRVASWRLSDRELGSDAGKWLERALWWSQGLHPALRRLLLAEGRIPTRLWYTTFGLGSRTDVELRFDAARDVGSDGWELTGVTRTVNPDDPLEQLVEQLQGMRGANAKEPPTRDALIELARQANETNRLDAFLLVSEWSLQSGELDAVQTVLGATIADDAQVQRLLEATTRTAAEADAAVTALRGFDRSKFTHPYVLDTFLATAVAAAGRQDEAQSLLLGALKQNPWMATTWKELGDLYYRYQDMDRAWLSWNAARKLQPNLKTLRSVLEIEAKLSNEFRAFL